MLAFVYVKWQSKPVVLLYITSYLHLLYIRCHRNSPTKAYLCTPFLTNLLLKTLQVAVKDFLSKNMHNIN